MKSSDIFIEKLYKEKYTPLCHYIQRMIPQKELAEDVAQETFFEAYRKRETLMEHESPVGWLYLTAKNKMMNVNQKQRKYSTMKEVEDDIAELDTNFGRIDFENYLQHTLSKEEIELFYKFYDYGYSSREMAQKLGVSENCFKTKMFRIRKKIKSAL